MKIESSAIELKVFSHIHVIFFSFTLRLITFCSLNFDE